MLPHGQGQHPHCPVQGDPQRRVGKILRQSQEPPLHTGLDHHALDPAVQHRPLRRPQHRLRGSQHFQPLYRASDYCHPRQGKAARLLPRKGCRAETGILQARRQSHSLRSGGRIQRQRNGRHALRTADALPPAHRRGCVPRDQRRLRDHRRRYRHRAYRPQLRGGRLQGGQAQRHRFPLLSGPPRPLRRRHGRVFGPFCQTAIRAGLRPQDHRTGGRGHHRQAQEREPGLQIRQARTLLPALLAYRQAYHLLPVGLLVHPDHGLQGKDDRPQQDHRLEARSYRYRAFRQLARKPGRLEPLPVTLLGNPAAHLGIGRPQGTALHRLGSRTQGRNRKVRQGRLHEQEPARSL